MKSKRYCRSTIVEAIQWTGDNFNDVKEFCPQIAKFGNTNDLELHKTVGDLDWVYCDINLYDYIIKEGSHYYIYTDSLFNKYYKEVKE